MSLEMSVSKLIRWPAKSAAGKRQLEFNVNSY